MPLLGGVRPPIAAFLCLLTAVCALTALTAGSAGRQAVPQALRDAERNVAADAAASERVSVGTAAETIRQAAAAYQPDARGNSRAALKTMVAGERSVLGAVLLDARNGRPMASTGENVPLFGVDAVAQERNGNGSGGIAPRLVGRGPANARLLFFARLTLPAHGASSARRWLLVVSEQPVVPAVYGGDRSVRLVDRDGRVIGAAGAATGAEPRGAAHVRALAGPDHRLPGVVADAADAAPQALPAAGSLLGTSEKDGKRRTLAGWSSVTPVGGRGDTADLGMVVLTTREVRPHADAANHAQAALYAAGLLALLTLLITLLLVVIVQRPLLRLHLSAGRLARAAHGEGPANELVRPVPVPRFGEPARIGRALEELRRQLLSGAGPGRVRARRGPGTRALVACCAVLIAAWSVPLILFVNRAHAATVVPSSVVADQQSRTRAAADRVRQSLDQHYLDLAVLGNDIAGKSVRQDAAVLRRALARRAQYRSLYVLDRTGRIVLRVGGVPLRTLHRAPGGSGITRVNDAGRVPAVAAYVQIPAQPVPAGGEVLTVGDVSTKAPVPRSATAPGAPAVLFGEIDVHTLDSALSRPELGSVWLTDDRRKVLAANVGFTAFQALPDSGLTRLVGRTEGTAGTIGTARSAVLGDGATPVDDASVAAAVPLAADGPAAGLGWRVVSSEPALALRLTAYQVQAHTMLAGMLALAVAIATLGWLHIVVVRPLRQLARLAEQLAGGDRRTVLYPVNFDEAGSVTRSLELLRQALVARRTPKVPAAFSEPASRVTATDGTPSGLRRK